ncbi:MAG: hypothetical protein DRI97_03205 [Bacteroidetes bacterium]|nr:MAG: hypothetical protein DRI97_03205 [Bacteroidota bacterium]
MSFDSTICALATPGHGAIAVIRVSGPNAIGITQGIFQAATPGRQLANQAPNTIHFGTIHKGDELIDGVLVSLFKAPRS